MVSGLSARAVRIWVYRLQVGGLEVDGQGRLGGKALTISGWSCSCGFWSGWKV